MTHTTRRPKLHVVVASTRPGRVGLPVARWFEARARDHGAFDLEIVDLAEIDLPFMDEPHHPRLQRYEHQHTRDWSAKVDAADAFVFVMPEYNHGIVAPLKNAIDYLSREWAYKPLGLVTYGGVAAGTRAAQMTKQIVAALKMTPLPEAVTIPFIKGFLGADGEIEPNDVMNDAAEAMLDELLRWTGALAPLREEAVAAD